MMEMRVVLTRLDPALLKPPVKCDFCYRTESDELLYGKMHSYEGINAHYYCLLFAGNLLQNGEDGEGILGFLPKDIREEIRRSQGERCSYCSKPGATVICVQRMCKKVFHLPCGMKNGSMHHFFRNFQSFCKNHRPYQKVPQSQLMLPEAPTCAICLDPVKRDVKSRSVVWASCCKVNWLHHLCVQKLALHSGYFFKCPRCNNKPIFSKAMLYCGIYIPEKDASWELEPNAFEELHHRHSECNAEICACPLGRKTDSDDTDWEVILCESCGSQGIHVGCLEPARRNWRPKWNCTVCLSAINEMNAISAPPSTRSITETAATTEAPSCSGVSTASPRRLTTGSPRRLSPVKRPAELVDRLDDEKPQIDKELPHVQQYNRGQQQQQQPRKRRGRPPCSSTGKTSKVATGSGKDERTSGKRDTPAGDGRRGRGSGSSGRGRRPKTTGETSSKGRNLYSYFHVIR